MKYLFKAKRNRGHMSVCTHADGITAASVQSTKGERPQVEWISFVPHQPFSPMASLEALAGATGGAHYTCSHVLNKDEYQLSLVDTPNTPPNEWKAAIRWRLRELLDFPVTDATVDVLPIPGDHNTMGQAASLYAVAARNQTIREKQAWFESAKMRLTVIDIPEMAQRNIATLLETPERAIAMLSCDMHGALLTISYLGELYVARRIEISTLQLEQADDEQRRETFERLTVELQRTLDHFERQFRHVVLARMILGPMGNATTDVHAHLGANLYVPVELLDFDEILDLENVPELRQREMQQRFFLTLGAALRTEEIAG